MYHPNRHVPSPAQQGMAKYFLLISICLFVSAGVCTDPGALVNGQRTPIRRSYPAGSVVHFICNSGFHAQGTSRSTICLNNGQWSHEKPTCVRRECSTFFLAGSENKKENFGGYYCLCADQKMCNMQRPFESLEFQFLSIPLGVSITENVLCGAQSMCLDEYGGDRALVDWIDLPLGEDCCLLPVTPREDEPTLVINVAPCK